MKHQPPAARAAQATDTSAASATAAADTAPDTAPGTAAVPTFEELLADPEIAALTGFAPVPRRFKKEGGWSADLQRMFIARLARHGSPGKACDELGMYRSGVDKLFKSAGAEAFRAAWAGAVALAERRRAERIAAGHSSTAGLTMPFVDNRRTARSMAAEEQHSPHGAGLPGQAENEFGQWEDEGSIASRAEDARGSIRDKLLRSRRLFLQEISVCPGRRAAFELLTDLPIDWGKAERMEPQDHEPGRIVNERKPDMILTAEAGWSFGEIGYGEDKKAELRREMDAYRAEQGMPPIEWDGE
jgi:hypothetical protein